MPVNKALQKLFKEIEENCKSGYKARYNEKGELIKNVANLGLTKFGKAEVSRAGEYNGLAVEAMDEIKPILTNNRIIRALTFISEGNMQSAVRVLQLDEYYVKYGSGVVHYVIKSWLENNNFEIPDIIEKDATIKKDNELENFIVRNIHDSLHGKIKIVNIGTSLKGNSVVPEAWIGRIFKSGDDLHEHMDDLDWRKGKPPVSFCCVYSMTLIDESKWIGAKEIKSYNFNNKSYYVISCKLSGDNINSSVSHIDSKSFSKIKDNVTKYDSVNIDEKNSLIIIYDKRLFVAEPKYIKTANVGVLVSRLQKSIRRGSGCIKLLMNTVKNLNDAPHYNIPDQHFARVSGTRQLLWRSYITIIEDACPFVKPKDGIDLLDFCLLAIICNIETSLQLASNIVDKILRTLVLVQNSSKLWQWEKGSNKEKEYQLAEANDDVNRTVNSMITALNFMPMMAGDDRMLNQSIDYLKTNKNLLQTLPATKTTDLVKLSNSKIEEAATLAAFDMHCVPSILLLLQGSCPINPETKKFITTRDLSGFIWDYSSKLNFRVPEDMALKVEGYPLAVLNELNRIQKKLNGDTTTTIKFDMGKIEKDKSASLVKVTKIDEAAKRLGFLLLFGAKVRLSSEGKNKPSLEIIVSGTNEFPCKVKRTIEKDKYAFLEGKERFEGELRYVQKLSGGLAIHLEDPPIGYDWTFTKNKVKIRTELASSDDKTFKNKINFYVDDIKLDTFDAAKVLKPIDQVKSTKLDAQYTDIIKKATYQDPKTAGFEVNLLMRNIANTRFKIKNDVVYDWVDLVKKSPLLDEAWRQLYARIYIDNNSIQVGPIDRSGNKTHNSISFEYEGVFWRLLNMLAMLYPRVLTLSSEYKYDVNVCPEYFHMTNAVYDVVNRSRKISALTYPNVTITVKLWDHQEKSVSKMYDGIINHGKKGFGDASHVGAGKTLTAIGLLQRLYNYNKSKKINNYYGFLVMVPSTKLYKTWEDEIVKHSKGFNLLKQEANGDLNGEITVNTILLTTMGRMREHPVSHPWVITCIDECLSVQNQNALQTASAFVNVVASQYGVVMLSATFFRSRFDKLYYMLRMLKTGLPEQAEYLDAILAESMVCNITENDRKWITNIHKVKLTQALRLKYDKLVAQYSGPDYEKAYIELNKFINQSCPYTEYFKNTIKDIEKERSKAKILIFCKSKDEADEIAEYCDNVSRYPDKSKKHVVLSYAEGTYGLNDLVIYDTLLTRVPYPDFLPQMMGRLNRPGQQKDVLYLEYILIEHTIEEAALFRIQTANEFLTKYILPIGEFYKIAIEKSSVKKNK
jgi:hypothetical protein